MEEVPKGGYFKDKNEKVQGLPFVKEEAKVGGMSKAKRKKDDAPPLIILVFSTAHGISHRPSIFCSCSVNCLRGTNHLPGHYCLCLEGSDLSHP